MNFINKKTCKVVNHDLTGLAEYIVYNNVPHKATEVGKYIMVFQ